MYSCKHSWIDVLAQSVEGNSLIELIIFNMWFSNAQDIEVIQPLLCDQNG